MENNITAVQFIKEQIELHSDTSFFNIDWNKFDEVIEKAKEMEKEQIIEAYENGDKNGADRIYYHSDRDDKSAEQYYNETFKSE